MNKTIIIVTSIAALVFAASVAAITYATSVQAQRFHDEHDNMSLEECEQEMTEMHGSGYGSMMNGMNGMSGNHNGMMQGSETSNYGCHGH